MNHGKRTAQHGDQEGLAAHETIFRLVIYVKGNEIARLR